MSISKVIKESLFEDPDKHYAFWSDLAKFHELAKSSEYEKKGLKLRFEIEEMIYGYMSAYDPFQWYDFDGFSIQKYDHHRTMVFVRRNGIEKHISDISVEDKIAIAKQLDIDLTDYLERVNQFISQRNTDWENAYKVMFKSPE